jgi:mannose-6-phosphate isomerase-like protein (cupin superfamily)
VPHPDQPKQRRFELVDFNQLPGIPCPCGTARRAFAGVEDFPGTVHRTDISSDAVTHYHKKLTEVYYILECGNDASMQLDDETITLQAGMCVLIRPGVRHRAVGQMEVLILCLPKFDEDDEWFD